MEGVGAKSVVQKYINHKKTQSSFVVHPEGSQSYKMDKKKPDGDQYVENLNISKEKLQNIDFTTKIDKNQSHIIVRSKHGKQSQLQTQDQGIKSLLGDMLEDHSPIRAYNREFGVNRSIKSLVKKSTDTKTN